jgi:hypothetical protein
MCVAESENVGSTPACYPIQPVGVNRSAPLRRATLAATIERAGRHGLG